MISNKTTVNGDKSGYINIRQVQPDVYRVVCYFDGIKKEFNMDVPVRPELKTSQLLELALKYFNNEKALIEALLNG